MPNIGNELKYSTCAGNISPNAAKASAIIVSTTCEVDKFWFAGNGACSLGSNVAKAVIWKEDNSIVTNSVVQVGTGSFHYKRYCYWYSITYTTKPVLTPGTYYIGFIGHPDGCANVGAYPVTGANVWGDANNFTTPQSLAGKFVSQSNYALSAYLVVTETAGAGPGYKIERTITPDKLENTSWSDISDVR